MWAVASALSFFTEPLEQGIVQRSLLEMTLIGLAVGALGCWIVLYGTSYSAESLSHSLLPGLVVATLVGVPLLIGGALAALVAAIAIAAAGSIEGVGRDAAVAVVITTVFGAGVLLALSPSSPPGIGGLLFGDPLAVSKSDLVVSAALSAVILLALRLMHTRFLVAGFDRSVARGLGASPRVVEVSLLVLTALAVLVAVQALGNLLVVAVLVGPAAIARQLSDRLLPMMVLAFGLTLLAATVGLYLSYWAGLAAGAAIAASIAVMYVASTVVTDLRG
jgi:ABC-type Mn2+/Zn2+ transport system permease subunit